MRDTALFSYRLPISSPAAELLQRTGVATTDGSDSAFTMALTLQILSDRGDLKIEHGRARLIAQAALQAEAFLFAAMLEEPSSAELHAFREDFILRCVTVPNWEAR